MKPTLKEVLQLLAEYDQGKLPMDEKVHNYQQILRDSKVLGELENGNIYVLRYSIDQDLYVVHNMNTGPLVYISSYDEYLDNKAREEGPYGL